MTMLETAPPVSRHKCLVYEGHPREQLPIVVPLLLNGLRDRYRCLYLGSPEMVELVEAELALRGLDVGAELRRGALLLSSDRGHLQNGVFDPRAMIAMLRDSIGQAVQDGFTGLCATGDMAWELGGDENLGRLLEYEALLEKLFPELPLTGICQYRRDALPAAAIQDALLAHRSIHIGPRACGDNLFYIPPEVLLEGGERARDRRGEWMLQQITKILRAENDRDLALEALRRSETEQRMLAQKLIDVNQGLEQLVRERTADLEAFSYSVSHDLRAPLRAVDSFTRILIEDHGRDLHADARGRLDQVLAATSRMTQLIDDLLAFSQASRSPLSSAGVDMTALARDVVEELLGRIPKPAAVVTLGALPAAHGDAALLRQVFINLVDNALKYSAKRPDPRIEIGGRTEAGEHVYWVRDNGAGFDMRHRHKLFEAFERLHAKSQFEGNGIGLALVKRIIDRHRGRVSAEGAVDQGATFTFALPRR